MEKEKLVYVAACRFYQSKQAEEHRRFKEAGALILKSKTLISESQPEKQISKDLKSKLSKLIQSNAATIQAAILLPQETHAIKGNIPRIFFDKRLAVFLNHFYDRKKQPYTMIKKRNFCFSPKENPYFDHFKKSI